MTTERSVVSQERAGVAINGWIILLLVLAVFIVCMWSIFTEQLIGVPLLWVVIVLGLDGLMLNGFFSLQPNEARVLVLFGAYHGTVRKSGFWWANPLYAGSWQGLSTLRNISIENAIRTKPASLGPAGKPLGRNKISLRARTLNGERLKVNDKRGNPIEIAAVVVWRISDTAQAFFDVDDYQNYVPIQSESALRHIANLYSYDDGDGEETTLRNNVDEVSEALRAELQVRLGKAGVVVDEARLTHLAYAPEIAQVMLRRQQAEAVIAARQKIVHGAVSMVDIALRELAEKDVVQLDDERRAAMVSNLMVVLCSESEVKPIVNTGTLYS
jgi:regulator of protease activity HflC (stomatin/prohibitin superfamily)